MDPGELHRERGLGLVEGDKVARVVDPGEGQVAVRAEDAGDGARARDVPVDERLGVEAVVAGPLELARPRLEAEPVAAAPMSTSGLTRLERT